MGMNHARTYDPAISAGTLAARCPRQFVVGAGADSRNTDSRDNTMAARHSPTVARANTNASRPQSTRYVVS